MDALMTLWVLCIGIFIGILIGVWLSYKTAVDPLQHRMQTLTNQKHQMKEAMRYYPYDPDNFRFIGSPVDGIQFEEDSILFVWICKDHTSRTKEQDHIKTLLKQGKVRWFEFMTT